MSDLNKLKELALIWSRSDVACMQVSEFSDVSGTPLQDSQVMFGAANALGDFIDRLEAAEAELARRDEAAGEPVAHIIQDESCFPGMVGHIHVDFTPTCRDVKNNGTVQPLYAATQPSVLPHDIEPLLEGALKLHGLRTADVGHSQLSDSFRFGARWAAKVLGCKAIKLAKDLKLSDKAHQSHVDYAEGYNDRAEMDRQALRALGFTVEGE